MKFTREQQSVLAGTILGDAFLQKTGKKNARLRLEHGAAQREYLLWKMAKFPRLFQGEPKTLSRIHPESKQTYHYVRAQSNATPELGTWRAMFYPDGKKHVPDNLSELIREPESVAVWYMDDGYFNPKDRNSFLYLGRVTKEEAETAKNAIEANFGIHPKVYDKKKKGFALFFGVEETGKLHDLIRPYVLSMFSYKLTQ